MPKRLDKPQFIAIKDIVIENPSVKTFYFEYELKSKPGQFVMLWIPGINQNPFSIRHDDGKSFSLTIFKLGALTKKLFEMKVGDRVGISGPYGKPFSVQENTHYIMAAGGYGAAPLAYLTEKVIELGSTVDFCVGARNKELLLFEDYLSKLENVSLHISTDDGSAGHKGYVTDLLKNLIEKNNHLDKAPKQQTKKILVATCGPEVMEAKILELCNEKMLECEISIERYMKCGFGICGQCCVDPLGIPMCVKGPVVSKETANQIIEFGKYSRDKSGAKNTH